MHWIKEHVLECEDFIALDTRGIMRVYTRLRSDGSMWYAIDTPALHSESNPLPSRVEVRFESFLTREVPFSIHSGWSEQDFDEDFIDRLQRMNGKEITPVTS